MATQEPTAPGERELRSAIQRLYSTFNRYKLSQHVVGCPCCTSAEDGRVLESRPLHELGAGELDRFAFKGMSTLGTAVKIRLPFAAPYIFTGFKLAVAYAFVGVVGAEFITSSRGIGYEISYAYNNFDNAVMYPLILLILVIAIVVNMSLYAWERRLLARRLGSS